MLDTVDGSNQSRRAKPVSRPNSDSNDQEAPSFANTMIGLAQPTQTPAHNQEPRTPDEGASQPETNASKGNGTGMVSSDAAHYANQTDGAQSHEAGETRSLAPPDGLSTPTTPTPPLAPALTEQGVSKGPQAGTKSDDLALMAMLAGLGLQTMSPEPATQTTDAAQLSLLQSLQTPIADGAKALFPTHISAQANTQSNNLANAQAAVVSNPFQGADANAWSKMSAQLHEQQIGGGYLSEPPSPPAATFVSGTDSYSSPGTKQIDAIGLKLEIGGEAKGPGAQRAGEMINSHVNALKGNGSAGWTINTGTQGGPSGTNTPTPDPSLLQTTNSGQAMGLATGALIGSTPKSGPKDSQSKVEGIESIASSAPLIGSGDGVTTASRSDALNVVAGGDVSHKPPSLGPQTIPLLAAAMMRRYNNGMKEFTLRLDPPELGRVDVRLTVSANKKVRAVVSTDRAEALNDLTRSARDLARALMDSGLELEENGLSFSMSDQGHAQHQHGGEQSAPQPQTLTPDKLDSADAARVDIERETKQRAFSPVEIWQRTRIALTA
ncbi:flagellar hook-length control protein FliK [Candidatus Phycosocius spiralis]|uniref:Flagellar hook-length control protein n=1 Tax=Candidatus Phycosocius spiralis TaxID=2815099 RepID=A0ABQ4PT83_9PROT|nr:flagellar hook-length control protein FliK [Candidatus Phycosocius spiralis]GIU66221.1 flagellar hook-length control protein [Candidatus Phycosocius spiralis]